MVRSPEPGPRGRSRSPSKNRSTNEWLRGRSKSPTKANPRGKSGSHGHQDFDLDFSDFTHTPGASMGISSPKKNSRRPKSGIATQPATPNLSIAERRNAPRLPYVDTTLARQQAKQQVLDRYGHGAIVVQRPPPEFALPVPGSTGSRSSTGGDSSPSVYSQDDDLDAPGARISPLKIRKGYPSVLDDYNNWRNSPAVPDTARRLSTLVHSQSSGELQTGTPFRNRQPSKDVSTSNATATTDAEPIFSPLTPFFQGMAAPGVRKGGKTLIGDNGWLEKTSKKAVQPKTSPARRANFFESLVKKAKGMVEKGEAISQGNSREPDKARLSRTLAISLTSREQSLIYCELEFILTTALNGYLTYQFNSGRLDPQKLHKIEEAWKQKGRPRVQSFRYDLETQLDLLRLHVNDFRFYGRTAAGPAGIIGIIDMMRVNARVIRIRTFCQPDTVIAKQILDSECLFDLLGCPEALWTILQNIKGFFRGILKREDMYLEPARVSMSTAADTSQMADTSHSMERQDDPSRTSTSGRRSPTKRLSR